MGRPKKAGSTAVVVLKPGQITRADANKLLQARAVELFQAAKSKQERDQQEFAAVYGSFDQLDQSLLGELQRLQMRFAAIARRQQMQSAGAYGTPEPKVSKFVEQLGAMIGGVSAYMATNHVASLFENIREIDYIPNQYGSGGAKGIDESVLEGLEIVDELKPADGRPVRRGDSTEDEDVCLHEHLEPAFSEDGLEDPENIVCADCQRVFVKPPTVVAAS